MFIKDFRFLNKLYKKNDKDIFNIILWNSKYLSKQMEELYLRLDIIRDKLIIADGGFKFYSQIQANYKIKDYNLIIGDLDSINIKPNERVLLDKDQNSTDLDKAMDYMLKNFNFNKLIIFGGFNSRMDHLLHNYTVLNKYCDKEIYFITENSIATILKKGENKVIFSEYNENKYIGIIPLFKEVVITNTVNLDYNMNNFKLSMTGIISSCNSSSKENIEVNTQDNVLYLASLFE